MKGKGVKRLNGGELEIGGIFEKNTVNGKGHKKWSKVVDHVQANGKQVK